MGAYGSPELHPKLRDNGLPPKKKCPAIFKRASFWFCVVCVLCEIFLDDTGNIAGMLAACCISVFVCEGLALLCNAIRGRRAKANAIAVICSFLFYLAIGIYLDACA